MLVMSEEKNPFNGINHKLVELENKITTLENMHFTYDNPLDEDEKHEYQDIRLWERIEKLEGHDIFRIWESLRKGGKTTLDAILKDNARIKELGKELSELKERVDNISRNWASALLDRFKRNEEVLRDVIDGKSFVKRKELLDKLGGEKVERESKEGVQPNVSMQTKGSLTKSGDDSKPPSNRIDEKVYYNKEQAGHPNKNPSEQDKLRDGINYCKEYADRIQEMEKQPTDPQYTVFTHITHCPKCNAQVRVKCRNYRDNPIEVEKEELLKIFNLASWYKPKAEDLNLIRDNFKKKYLEEDHE